MPTLRLQLATTRTVELTLGVVRTRTSNKDHPQAKSVSSQSTQAMPTLIPSRLRRLFSLYLPTMEERLNSQSRQPSHLMS